jgi:MscS family membrane protein
MIAALCQLLTLLAVTWVIFRTVDIGAEALAERARIREHQGLASVLPLARVTFKAALGLLALIVGLQNFGVNVTGLLAGLGFGGLAFALASQKTLENLFGGVTVIADQPVRVGDFCRFGDRVGTVEDIGLRSTRVRTVERTVITVPNGEFATMQLENFAKRDSIRFAPRLGLRYETTPDQMRYALVEMRRLLYSHPMVDPEGARVRFAGFGSSSLDVDIVAYIRVTDWAKYLEVAEDLNLRLMDVVDEAGSGFAFPSQTLYVSHDDGLDSERSKAAERSVAEWRERGELAHPDFSPEALRSIAGTTTFPEAGSQTAELGTKAGPSGGPAEE